MPKYEDGVIDVDELEGVLNSCMAKRSIDKRRGCIRQVVSEVSKEESSRGEENEDYLEIWRECWDSAGESHWVCTAAKR